MTGGCSGGGRLFFFFFLLAKRKGICSFAPCLGCRGKRWVGGGGGLREGEGLQVGLFPAGLGDLSQICAK